MSRHEQKELSKNQGEMPKQIFAQAIEGTNLVTTLILDFLLHKL